MRRFLILLSLTVLFSSCYSYRIFPKANRDFEYHGERETAFVVNPELKKEYAILQRSGIFKLTKDSSSAGVVKVRLQPLSRGFVCGNPIIGSLITLGQVPVYFPDIYQYRFEEIGTIDRTSKNFELQIAERVWFWDLFVIPKNFSAQAGKALFASYYKK